MEKVAVIKSVKHVKGWVGNEETLYFHEVIMDNGDEGKLDVNKEESPSWLFPMSKIRYSTRFGKKGLLIKFLGLAGQPSQPESTSSNQHTHRKVNHEVAQERKQPYAPRADSDPAFRLRQQKCISLTTCLDRANELVIAGEIEHDKKHSEALNDFNFIMKHSGIAEMEKEPASQNEEKPNTASHGSESNAVTSSSSSPELFADEPVSGFLQEAISRCDTTKQLTNLRGQLRENEASNKNVLTAIHNREQEIKKKK